MTLTLYRGPRGYVVLRMMFVLGLETTHVALLRVYLGPLEVTLWRTP